MLMAIDRKPPVQQASERPKDKGFAATFESLGVVMGEAITPQTENVPCDCPFCGKESHFFANVITGQWDCKICGRSGNIHAFLEQTCDFWHLQTTPEQWQLLADNRGLPAEAFQPWRIGYNAITDEWLIPCFSERGTVRDVGRFDLTGGPLHKGGSIRSTPECFTQLQNTWELSQAVAANRSRKVWVCEGAWDMIAMEWLLSASGGSDPEVAENITAAVPGAGTWKPEWNRFFHRHDVVICFDNDGSGDKGAMRAGTALAGIASRRSYLNWPETLPEGWDLRDHIRTGLKDGKPPTEIFGELEILISARHRRDHSPTKAASGTSRTPEPLSGGRMLGSENAAEAVGNNGHAAKILPNILPPERGTGVIGGTAPFMTPDSMIRPTQPVRTFGDVVRAFSEWAVLDRDFKDALAISLGVCLTIDIPGDPLWMYLVAPPGGGKTLILASLATSERCRFYSTMKAESLMSGFKMDPDPSMLPEMNGYTGVVKEGTMMLKQPPEVRDQTYALLRDAYDGNVFRKFGNGVIRSYPDLHFNLLVAITPAIHGDSQATVGERFLRFEMRERYETLVEKIRKAVSNTSHEREMNIALQAASSQFLASQKMDLDNLPAIPAKLEHCIVAMAQIVALLRSTVDRDFRDRDEKYRADTNIDTGIRVGKQLKKLAIALCLVYDRREADADVHRLLWRVAHDSAIGFHVDVIKSLIRNRNDPMTKTELSAACKIPLRALDKRIEDLLALGILIPTAKKGLMNALAGGSFVICDRLVDLWNQAIGTRNDTRRSL